MADYDSTYQNFMLYSPPGFEGWYFLPWDYDGAWGWNDQPGAPRLPRCREGVANWWSVVLHRRFLSEPHNLAELDRAHRRAGVDHDHRRRQRARSSPAITTS